MEAREENEASDDEWEAELNKLTQKLASARCRQLGHWKDDHCCLVRVTTVNRADGAGKLEGELGTVSAVLGSDNSVNLRPLCHSNESLSHDFELGNSTCAADVCFYKPNLDDSIVSDCDDTHSCTDDAIQLHTRFCTPCRKCWANALLYARRYSVANPACLSTFCHFLHSNIDSESVVKVRSDRTEEGSRTVSGASGSPITGNPAVWTRTTKDSWMHDGLVTCGQLAYTSLSLGGSVQSAFVGSEGIADTDDDDDLGDNLRKRKCPWCG